MMTASGAAYRATCVYSMYSLAEVYGGRELPLKNRNYENFLFKFFLYFLKKIISAWPRTAI